METKTYRFRPNPVQAFQLTTEIGVQIGESKGADLPAHLRIGSQYGPAIFLDVKTSQGFVRAGIGDFIVEGPAGHFEVVSAEAFAEKYVAEDQICEELVICGAGEKIAETDNHVVLQVKKKKRYKASGVTTERDGGILHRKKKE